MSNDDLGNLPPLGGKPLEGDLEDLPPLSANPLEGDLESLPPPGAGSLGADLGELPPASVTPLGDDTLEEIGEAASLPPLTGEAAEVSPLAGEEGVIGVSAGEGIAEAEEPAEKKPGFLAKLAEANPYTVILAASLVALLIGILCLLLEWGSYNFDTKAKELGQSAPVSVPLHSSTPAPGRVVAV